MHINRVRPSFYFILPTFLWCQLHFTDEFAGRWRRVRSVSPGHAGSERAGQDPKPAIVSSNPRGHLTVPGGIFGSPPRGREAGI